ncbi:MAG TPA: amino acid permease [Terriglobia bacterium]
MPAATEQPKIPAGPLPRTLGILAATSVVIANVIGVGIFTTPGFLARDLGSPSAVLGIWLLGAILALAGALSYSELGAAFPEAGGEYVYLREAYGPLWGYLSGWICFFASFSGPIAAACIGFAAYVSHFAPALGPDYVLVSFPIGGWEWRLSGGQVAALLALWGLTVVHTMSVERGGRLQVALTIGKTAALAVFVLLGFWLGSGNWGHLRAGSEGHLPPGALRSLPVSLIFVLYCYSGWNAAAYLAGEVRDPNRNLPRSLLIGTGCVTVLYVALNVLFLYGLGVEGMSGVLQIGEKASGALFGPSGADWVSALMALSILASASAMILAGPRVYFAMAADGVFPKRLAGVHRRYATPASSILAQSLWASVLLLTGTFEQLVVYSGFVLVLFSGLAVATVIVLRVRRPELARPFRVPLYPATPLLFVAFSAWILVFTLRSRPTESLLGIATALLGLPLYFYWRRRRL